MGTLRGDRAMGIRVEPKCIHYAIVDGSKTEPRVETIDALTAAKTFSAGQALAWYAKELAALCSRHLPAFVWVREAESMAKVKRDHIAQRARIEGVVIAVSSAQGARVTLGQFASITAQLTPSKTSDGMKKKQAKMYLEADEFRGIDWRGNDQKEREAILVAVAALP